MKKWMLFVVIMCMLGWAVYDLIDSDRKAADQMENEDEIPEVKLEHDNEGAEIAEKPTIGLEVGKLAPDFQLQMLTGGSVKLSDFRGKRVLINFWATWCPPCRAEMPDMEKFYQEKDIVILAVNLTESESNLEDVEDFSDEYKLTFPILMDTNLVAADLYAIRPIPTTYMIDSNGMINYKVFGAMNYDLMVQEFEKME